MTYIKKHIVTLYNWIYDQYLDVQLFFRWRKDLRLQKKLGLPKIMTIRDTLNEISEKSLSVCRYGDGEFKIMDGEKIFFQENSSSLSERLKEVISTKDSRVLICLPTFLDRRHSIILGNKGNKEERKRRRNAIKYMDSILAEKREKWYAYFDFTREYGNSLVTRCYVSENDSDADEYFKTWKTILSGRDVLIVEGEKTRFGVGNDLLAGCNSVRRILCPAKSAFTVYNSILKSAIELHKDNELCIVALGPTATVLAYDLAQKGIQAIDIGHLDIEYEWFLRGDRTHRRIEGKFVSEAKDGDQVGEISDYKYKREILRYISC